MSELTNIRKEASDLAEILKLKELAIQAMSSDIRSAKDSASRAWAETEALRKRASDAEYANSVANRRQFELTAQNAEWEKKYKEQLVLVQAQDTRLALAEAKGRLDGIREGFATCMDKLSYSLFDRIFTAGVQAIERGKRG